MTKRDYDNAMWFAAEVAPLAGIRDLHALLRRLEDEPSACIIRGAPAAGTDMLRTRRRKQEFSEAPRRWLMLDADGIPLPPCCSVLEDSADAARALLDILAAHAPELEGVTAVVQFSGRAGLHDLGEAAEAIGEENIWRGVAGPGLRAHVWYWLAQPLGEAELKRWIARLQAAGLKLDQATVCTVQPHYTAAPVFERPLRDPLTGRRTVLIGGDADAAEFRIPPEAERPGHAYGGVAGSAGSAGGGRGYAAFLGEIGGPDGFRAPILRAISSFVATAWPTCDTTALKADIRARIAGADPGGRPKATLQEYASDRHLDQMIAWALERERGKRAERQAEVDNAGRPVEPTFPDRGVPLEVAQAQVADEVARFATSIRAGRTPELMLQMTVGGGKSEAAIAVVAGILEAAHAAGRDGALYYLVPRHGLGGEVLGRIAKKHPGQSVAAWRGMDVDDPEASGKKMCRDLELPRLAAAAGLKRTGVCFACPLRDECGYRRQRLQDAGIWVAAHNMAFSSRPSALPSAAAMVIDEAFWPAGLAGMDAQQPVQMAVSALADERTGGVTGLARQRLLELRRLVAEALSRMDEGPVARGPFEALCFTAASAAEWRALEWRTGPTSAPVAEGMNREAIVDRLREAAASSGFNRLRPLMAQFIRALLEGHDARSVNTVLLRHIDLGRGQGSGDVVRFAWREDIAEWAKKAPKLILDATTRPDVVRQWVPALEVSEVEVQAPRQCIQQVIGRRFGRAFFEESSNNIRRLADLAIMALAEAGGEILIIAQQVVEEALGEELRRRFDGAQPDRLLLAHHGDITGLDRYRDVEHVVVVGRPATNRRDGERLAEVVSGQAIEVVADEGTLWPTVTGGIRLADGSGIAVQQPRHPDPLAEALRWSITEGGVLQAIGRARGVRRAVQVTLLAELALPLTVAEVTTWEEMLPGRLMVAATEGVLMSRALPLAPADLAAVRPDLWPSANAAELDLKRMGKRGQTLIRNTYKGLTPFGRLAAARYRKPGARRWSAALVPQTGGRAALEAVLGLSLDAYEPAATAPVATVALPPSDAPMATAAERSLPVPPAPSDAALHVPEADSPWAAPALVGKAGPDLASRHRAGSEGPETARPAWLQGGRSSVAGIKRHKAQARAPPTRPFHSKKASRP